MADPIPRALKERIDTIPTVTKRYGVKGPSRRVIERLGMFVDTHRDQPHIGGFHADIHRGQSLPIVVDYDPARDELVHPDTGFAIARHPKHMFITEDWFGSFILDRMMSGESDPRDADGILATSHLRDARAKVYLVKSFRQIVIERMTNPPEPK